MTGLTAGWSAEELEDVAENGDAVVDAMAMVRGFLLADAPGILALVAAYERDPSRLIAAIVAFAGCLALEAQAGQPDPRAAAIAELEANLQTAAEVKVEASDGR